MKQETYRKLIERAKTKKDGIYDYGEHRYKVRGGLLIGVQGRDNQVYTPVGFMAGCITKTSKSLIEL